MTKDTKLAPDELARRVAEAAELLELVQDNRGLLAAVEPEERTRLLVAAGQVARPGPWAKRELARAARRRRRAEIKQADEQALARTGIRARRREREYVTPVLTAPVMPEQPTEPVLTDARNCYVCKQDFRELHFFYDAMCPQCAELNWRKRHQSADLAGRVAVITGARVKIGYCAGLILLRAGASVVVTTRFPRDAAMRYSREPDFDAWGDRLQIHGLDLRHTPSVEAFTRYLNDNVERLDFIVNNACQTVRRPAGFYTHLMDAEQLPYNELSPEAQRLLVSYESMRAAVASRQLGDGESGGGALATIANAVGLQDPAALSQLALLEEDLDRSTHIFPEGQLDVDLQQVDLRSINSWRLPLEQVPAVELLEVHLVNAVAPFILNARLKPLMMRHPNRDKHIVNVSAMEGQFYRSYKTDKHPHTNMAKAALNMMTRTSAVGYVGDGIHMNAVDTGWITDEDPVEIAARKTAEHGFHPPLDAVDGAARICDPILDGYNTGEHVWGQFLKDYGPTDW